MTISYCLLNIFNASDVKPRVHKSEANHEQGYLLYAIGTRLFVDISLCIYNSMMQIRTAPLRVSLPFGVLICIFFMDIGVLADEHENSMFPRV